MGRRLHLPRWSCFLRRPPLSSSRLDCGLSVLQKPALMVSCFPALQGPSQLQIGAVTINLQSGLNPGEGHRAATTSGKSASCRPTGSLKIRCGCDLPAEENCLLNCLTLPLTSPQQKDPFPNMPQARRECKEVISFRSIL